MIKATHRGTGRKYACKIVNITRMEPRQVSKLYFEVSVMRELDHPHIVRMREVFYSKVQNTRQCDFKSLAGLIFKLGGMLGAAV